MKKYFLLIAIILFASCNNTKNNKSTIRVGWQTAWATQGQIIQAMEHTNIPNLCSLDINFLNFLFGPDLNEAAITDNIDVTNAGIVPVVNLLSASENWIIIGRQVDFLLSVVARKGANIKGIKDLKGKKFGIPIAGGSHPYAIKLLKENGLEIGVGPNKVEIINIKPSEMPITMKQGDIDAIACWEPTTTLAIDAGGIVIDEERYVGFICANKTFCEANRKTVVNLMKAYILGNIYVANHREKTDKWFSEVSGTSINLINRIKVIEPNVNAKTIQEGKFLVDSTSIKLLQEVFILMKSLNLVKSEINFSKIINMEYTMQALSELEKHPITFLDIKDINDK